MTLQLMPPEDPDYADAARRKIEAAAEALRCGASAETVQRMGQFSPLEIRRVRQLALAPTDSWDALNQRRYNG
ncbi:hypothetical protein EBN03_21945 [Nocardia stercoris]|uniref:Uncharacterized protein n=2 Tax=Nocardia stercoris TaxID=2483361 RepID=A0A3M2L060_9NOCA|nr:hypothetical protein EBN03_21945 [Nocardia stercoris]